MLSSAAKPSFLLLFRYEARNGKLTYIVLTNYEISGILVAKVCGYSLEKKKE